MFETYAPVKWIERPEGKTPRSFMGILVEVAGEIARVESGGITKEIPVADIRPR